MRAFFLIAISLLGVDFLTGFPLHPQNGMIIEQTTYSFPAYEQTSGRVKKYHSKEAYEKIVRDSRFEFLKLKYLSDGLKVVAYLYKPKNTQGQKLPTVIYNRGSYIRGDIADELVLIFHRLASEGFTILAPLYRGSDGGEGRDEMGGADVNDLMNILPVAKSLAFIDANNLFMYGQSRGGMMTFQAIRNGFPINAAAVFGAFTDLDELFKSDPKTYQQTYQPLIKAIWPDFDSRKDEYLRTRSVIRWAENITAPLLIMHGGADQDVNPAQSLNLALQLQRLGRKYELVIYADDNHILSRNQDDRDGRAINWFRTHLKK
ncbi:MAG: prolyl oligopeptidase family serine peptidase [Acidobacteria bacterium]|nr:prolyl oligopeptidase family serine peptidase [Acidobacteriota bacterium]